MKTKSLLILLAIGCVSLLHAEKITAGPKGGRLLDSTPLKAEFFVTAERHVEITFYDDHTNPILPGEQAITVTAEPTSGRTPLQMEKTAAGFLSKTPLPAGEPYRVVVQVRTTPEAKLQNFRIDLNLHTCGECQRKEYACICEGH
jgi:hypothetical protein